MTERNQQPRPLLPPHILWPSAVVVLLLLGVGSGFAALIAAHSDGGPAIVEDYYQQALAWDETQKARAESAALGWTAELAVPNGASAQRLVEVVVRDADGAPVSGLAGFVRARRADAPEAGAAVPLAEAPDAPGTYRQRLPIPRGGVWDFEIDAARGEARFLAILRREL